MPTPDAVQVTVYKKPSTYSMGSAPNSFKKKRKKWSQEYKDAEAKLIREAVAGSQKSFSVLYNRYHGQVFAFCMRMLNGKSDVEDAVQQVFLECWRSLYRFEGRSLFSTWLIKIAIHTCLSIYRKTSRTVLSIDADVSHADKGQEVLWASEPETPHEQLSSTRKRHVIEKIIDRMTIKKKTVFILSDIQGMTAPEISGILGIPDATVRTRLFHARKEFQLSINRNPVYKDLLGRVKKEKTRLA